MLAIIQSVMLADKRHKVNRRKNILSLVSQYEVQCYHDVNNFSNLLDNVI